MKKKVVIFSWAVLALACVFAAENRAAGQGATAGSPKAAQAKKSPAAEAPLPQVDKEKFARTSNIFRATSWKGEGRDSAAETWRPITSENSLRRTV